MTDLEERRLKVMEELTDATHRLHEAERNEELLLIEEMQGEVVELLDNLYSEIIEWQEEEYTDGNLFCIMGRIGEALANIHRSVKRICDIDREYNPTTGVDRDAHFSLMHAAEKND